MPRSRIVENMVILFCWDCMNVYRSFLASNFVLSNSMGLVPDSNSALSFTRREKWNGGVNIPRSLFSEKENIMVQSELVLNAGFPVFLVGNPGSVSTLDTRLSHPLVFCDACGSAIYSRYWGAGTEGGILGLVYLLLVFAVNRFYYSRDINVRNVWGYGVDGMEGLVDDSHLLFHIPFLFPVPLFVFFLRLFILFILLLFLSFWPLLFSWACTS